MKMLGVIIPRWSLFTKSIRVLYTVTMEADVMKILYPAKIPNKKALIMRALHQCVPENTLSVYAVKLLLNLGVGCCALVRETVLSECVEWRVPRRGSHNQAVPVRPICTRLV